MRCAWPAFSPAAGRWADDRTLGLIRLNRQTSVKHHSPSRLRVTPQQVAAFRLARHHLAALRSNDPVAVCRDVCGVQAQLMPAAQMNLAVRTRGLTPASIAAALWRDRSLVKTLCMRQTVHLLPAAEFSLYLAAVRRSRVAAVERIMARFDITSRDKETLNRVTLESLDAGPLPMRELALRIRPRVSGRVRAWMDRVWNPVRLSLVEGLICYGPDSGPQVTFARVDQWLPHSRTFEEGEAQRLVLIKFLRGYGPATLGDFSHWSGIPVSDARPVWERLAGDLAEVTVEGRSAWLLPRDVAELRSSHRRGTVVNLLAAFDSFLLAHAEKSHLVEPGYYKQVFRSLGQISPVVLVNGRITGTWKQAPGRKQTWTLSVKLFNTPRNVLRAQIEEQAERLGAFLGRRAETRFLPI